MSATLHIPLLGALVVEDVMVYYDGPQLFTARDIHGQCFLALAVAEDAQGQDFLYVPISGHRLSLVRTEDLGLRQAFAQPEDGILFRVRVPWQGDVTAAAIPATEVPAAWLPQSGSVCQGA